MKERYFVRTPDDDIAGWAYVGNRPLEDFDGTELGYMINQVFTVPKYRGQGYGSKIMQQIITDADIESERLVLDVDPGVDNYAPTPEDHQRLVEFYQSFGFVWDDNIGGMTRDPQPRYVEIRDDDNDS